MLVTALLHQLASSPQSYGLLPLSNELDISLPDHSSSEQLAAAATTFDVSAPAHLRPRKPSDQQRKSLITMDFKIDFGDTTGIQNRAKKAKKAAKQAQQASFWADENNEGEKKPEEGAEDGTGAGGDANGGAGGGDDPNGGGGGDDGRDDWDFGGSKKNKKKSKKKQQEEEEEEQRRQEEEQKRKEEEEAAAAASNSLDWAEDTNQANPEDDWATGFTTKKDKKKKKKVCWIRL